MPESGSVKWFSPRKGYGFIIRDSVPEGQENHEIFCHYSSIKMDGFKTLLPGLRVSFDVEQGKKEGTIEAKNVQIIPPEFKKEN
jgi:CspA family cold shock protein